MAPFPSDRWSYWLIGVILIVFSWIDGGLITSNHWVHLRFGNAVTVVEMDGEIDMDNMEEQLKDPENMVQLNSSLQ